LIMNRPANAAKLRVIAGSGLPNGPAHDEINATETGVNDEAVDQTCLFSSLAA